MPGYSGAPLVKKLGIKAGAKIFLEGAPSNYTELVEPLPEGTRVLSRLTASTDFIHIFSTSKTHLRKVLGSSLSKLAQDGIIWVSWPKKASKVQTDVSENVMRELAFRLGLVDIKVCAVDETWSGLKLVIRKALRKP